MRMLSARRDIKNSKTETVCIGHLRLHGALGFGPVAAQRLLLSSATLKLQPRSGNLTKTSTQASMAAITAVLNTTELCEQILLNLSFKDLLRFRRLNSFFRNVIQGSKALQRKLYLLPMAPGHWVDELNPALTIMLESHGFSLYAFRQHGACSRLVIGMDKSLAACPSEMPQFFADMLVHMNPHNTVTWIYMTSKGRGIEEYRLPALDDTMTLGDLEDALNVQREQIFGCLLRGSTMPIVLSSASQPICGPCTSSTHDHD